MDLEKSSDSDGRYCLKHHDQLVEYFCKTHRKLGCAKCMIKDHKICEDICEVSEDIRNTRDLLSSICSRISEGVNRFKKEKKDVANKCNHTLEEIDGLNDNLTSKIKEGLSEYKRFAEQNENEANAKIDLKLEKLHHLDNKVREFTKKIEEYENMMDYGSIKSCYNTSKIFEKEVKEIMQERAILFEARFVPSELSEKILADPVMLGNKSSLSYSRGNQAKTHSQTSYNMLENLAEMINEIKQKGNEVVFCLGKLIIGEKRNLKVFDYASDKTVFKTVMQSQICSLITVGSNHIAMILKELNKISCFKVMRDGTLRRHREFSDDNSWTEILTIAEGKGGTHILATIKGYDTSDFKHPATLTRVHKFFL